MIQVSYESILYSNVLALGRANMVFTRRVRPQTSRTYVDLTVLLLHILFGIVDYSESKLVISIAAFPKDGLFKLQQQRRALLVLGWIRSRTPVQCPTSEHSRAPLNQWLL